MSPDNRGLVPAYPTRNDTEHPAMFISEKSPPPIEEEAGSDPPPNRERRRHPAEHAEPAHARALGMTEAAASVGVSRSQLYEEAAEGRLITRKVGRRRLVLATDLDAWLAALPAA